LRLYVFRDLARNWNIDVAQELEDYLQELGSITISLDDGLTMVNFAEGFYFFTFLMFSL